MYRGLFMADIHIGAMSYEDTYDGILYIKSLLDDYTKDELLDFIIIGGDFFDKQLYANDPFISLAQKLMTFIYMSAKEIRIVYGTSSHDSNQYLLYSNLIDDLPMLTNDFSHNLKVISTVSEEELLPGMNVLYIPEEYIFDKHEYYKDYFNKKDYYDYVFGHGMIQEAFTHLTKNTKKKESNRRSAPVFKTIELSDICKGDVLFGHYHVHSEFMDDKVCYSGSMFRWIHGEEEDKGCYFLNADIENGKYTKYFIINNTAKKYITYHYGYDNRIFNKDVDLEEEAKSILKKKEKKNIFNLKLVFNIPLNYENPEAFINFWKERFKDNKDIKVNFTNGYVENINKRKNISFDELSEYAKILLDKSIPEEDKISYFLKVKRNVDMSPKKIKSYLEKLDI